LNGTTTVYVHVIFLDIPFTKQEQSIGRAGFAPRIAAHEIDSLEVVEDRIIASYGVGLKLTIRRSTR
jgi:hypothetical protein